MIDFLTFQVFITPSLLIVMYYFGVIAIPFVSYIIAKWVKSSYFKDVGNEIKNTLSAKQRLLIIGIAFFCFLCMEIFWRVIFEFFIAYFDMHDALMQIA